MNEEKIELLDFYAAKAMILVSAETQETIPASFWDYVKSILFSVCYMTFLEVRYKPVTGAKERIAKEAYLYAQAMLNERAKIADSTPPLNGANATDGDKR